MKTLPYYNDQIKHAICPAGVRDDIQKRIPREEHDNSVVYSSNYPEYFYSLQGFTSEQLLN